MQIEIKDAIYAKPFSKTKPPVKDKYDSDMSISLEIFFSYEDKDVFLDQSINKTRFGPLELIWFDDPSGCFDRSCETVPIGPIKNRAIIRDGPKLPKDSQLFCKGKEYHRLPLPSVNDCAKAHIPYSTIDASTSPSFAGPSSPINSSNGLSVTPSATSTQHTQPIGSLAPTFKESSLPSKLSKGTNQSSSPTLQSPLTSGPSSSPSFIINESNVQNDADELNIHSTIPTSKYELHNFTTEEQKLAKVLKITLCVIGTMWMFVLWKAVVKLFH